MADLKIDIASVFSGKKAFADASKSTLSLKSQVNSLAKSYLGLFTAQRLARSSFNAVKEFAADDKAARVLSRSLSNLGLAFSDPQVKTFIADLEKTFGVLDKDLRPAFQRLLTTTGDVAKSQKLLLTALDLSAAKSVDLISVAGDLSKAYVGQTRSLTKYDLGLTRVQLAALSFEEIQTRINTLFKGQAQLSADSYAGALDRLAVAGDNAKEAIGRGLVDALSVLGGEGQGSLNNSISLTDKLSLKFETLIRRLAVGAAQGRALLTGDLQGFRSIGLAEMNRGKIPSGITPAIAAELKKAAVEKAALKRSKEQSALLAKNTKAIKEQTALQKAGTLFDAEQTSIIAALKGKVTDEERTRLELQLAILTGNTSEASKLAGQLAKSQGLTAELVAYLKNLPDAKNPFSAWASYLDAIQAQVAKIATGGMVSAGAAGAGSSAIISNAANINLGDMTDFIPRDTGQTAFRPAAVNVIVTLDGQELTTAVSNVQTNNSLSGNQIAVNRRTGSFAATPIP
jgi:hypothetical protein